MILAQLDGAEGMILERPHPCRPRPASSAMAEVLPSLSISRRVSLCIGPRLFDAIAVTKVGRWAFLRQAVVQRAVCCCRVGPMCHPARQPANRRLTQCARGFEGMLCLSGNEFVGPCTRTGRATF